MSTSPPPRVQTFKTKDQVRLQVNGHEVTGVVVSDHADGTYEVKTDDGTQNVAAAYLKMHKCAFCGGVFGKPTLAPPFKPPLRGRQRDPIRKEETLGQVKACNVCVDLLRERFVEKDVSVDAATQYLTHVYSRQTREGHIRRLRTKLRGELKGRSASNGTTFSKTDIENMGLAQLILHTSGSQDFKEVTYCDLTGCHGKSLEDVWKKIAEVLFATKDQKRENPLKHCRRKESKVLQKKGTWGCSPHLVRSLLAYVFSTDELRTMLFFLETSLEQELDGLTVLKLQQYKFETLHVLTSVELLGETLRLLQTFCERGRKYLNTFTSFLGLTNPDSLMTLLRRGFEVHRDAFEEDLRRQQCPNTSNQDPKFYLIPLCPRGKCEHKPLNASGKEVAYEGPPTASNGWVEQRLVAYPFNRALALAAWSSGQEGATFEKQWGDWKKANGLPNLADDQWTLRVGGRIATHTDVALFAWDATERGMRACQGASREAVLEQLQATLCEDVPEHPSVPILDYTWRARHIWPATDQWLSDLQVDSEQLTTWTSKGVGRSLCKESRFVDEAESLEARDAVQKKLRELRQDHPERFGYVYLGRASIGTLRDFAWNMFSVDGMDQKARAMREQLAGAKASTSKVVLKAKIIRYLRRSQSLLVHRSLKHAGLPVKGDSNEGGVPRSTLCPPNYKYAEIVPTTGTTVQKCCESMGTRGKKLWRSARRIKAMTSIMMHSSARAVPLAWDEAKVLLDDLKPEDEQRLNAHYAQAMKEYEEWKSHRDLRQTMMGTSSQMNITLFDSFLGNFIWKAQLFLMKHLLTDPKRKREWAQALNDPDSSFLHGMVTRMKQAGAWLKDGVVRGLFWILHHPRTFLVMTQIMAEIKTELCDYMSLKLGMFDMTDGGGSRVMERYGQIFKVLGLFVSERLLGPIAAKIQQFTAYMGALGTMVTAGFGGGVFGAFGNIAIPIIVRNLRQVIMLQMYNTGIMNVVNMFRGGTCLRTFKLVEGVKLKPRVWKALWNTYQHGLLPAVHRSGDTIGPSIGTLDGKAALPLGEGVAGPIRKSSQPFNPDPEEWTLYYASQMIYEQLPYMIADTDGEPLVRKELKVEDFNYTKTTGSLTQSNENWFKAAIGAFLKVHARKDAQGYCSLDHEYVMGKTSVMGTKQGGNWQCVWKDGGRGGRVLYPKDTPMQYEIQAKGGSWQKAKPGTGTFSVAWCKQQTAAGRPCNIKAVMPKGKWLPGTDVKDPIRYGSKPSQDQQEECTAQGGLIVEGPLTRDECAHGYAEDKDHPGRLLSSSVVTGEAGALQGTWIPPKGKSGGGYQRKGVPSAFISGDRGAYGTRVYEKQHRPMPVGGNLPPKPAKGYQYADEPTHVATQGAWGNGVCVDGNKSGHSCSKDKDCPEGRCDKHLNDQNASGRDPSYLRDREQHDAQVAKDIKDKQFAEESEKHGQIYAAAGPAGKQAVGWFEAAKRSFIGSRVESRKFKEAPPRMRLRCVTKRKGSS